MTPYTYVSNQTYAGGFDTGMVQAGFKLIHKTEMKGGFGMANCLANRHILGHDWTHQSGDPDTWDAPHADVVVANPPCSGFSVMSAKHFRGADSPALSCTWAFAKYVTRVMPQIAVFESVQQAYTHKDGLSTMRALRDYVEEETGVEWTLYHVRHNAYSVGGPSMRRRYFWVISRVPFGIEMPELTMVPKLNDVIGDLATLPQTWSPQEYADTSHHPYVEQFRNPAGVVDGHIGITNPLIRRLHDIMADMEWKPGEHMALVVRRYYETFGRLPESWAPFQEKILKRDFHMGFTTPVRWNGNNPARVITGGSMMMVIHPWLNRMITHRESARILGFPDNWLIEPLQKVTGLHLTWGKGITVQCGRWIGEWIHRALDGEPGSYVGNPLGDREYDIDCTNTWKKVTQSHHTKSVSVV